MSESCKTCLFWACTNDGKLGDCRRHPPVASEHYPSVFPVTPGEQWCGEYQSRFEYTTSGDVYDPNMESE